MSSARHALLGVDPTRVDTSPEFGLGDITTQGGVDYVYLQANGAVAASTACTISTGSQAAESGNGGGVDCVSNTTALADNEYGWFAIRGEVVANVAASTAAGAYLARLADVNGDLVTAATGTNAARAKALTAESAGLSTVRLLP